MTKGEDMEPWDSDDILVKIFGVERPVIGTIHALPLPGSPGYQSILMEDIVTRAVKDAEAYVQGGIDGLIVENGGDIPFLKPNLVGPETVAALTAVACGVRQAVSVPIGVNCLANAVVQSIAIGKAAGGVFVRANQWANAYIANEGFVEGAAAEALRFRRTIGADEIAVFADVHVKHGSHAIVADRSLPEQTRDVESFGADVLIATGQRTGDAVPMDELVAIKEAATKPVILGSGLTAENAGELLQIASGAIVGSWAKHEGVWWNSVDTSRVAAIMEQVRRVR